MIVIISEVSFINYSFTNLSLLFRHGNFMVKTRSMRFKFVFITYLLFLYFSVFRKITTNLSQTYY